MLNNIFYDVILNTHTYTIYETISYFKEILFTFNSHFPKIIFSLQKLNLFSYNKLKYALLEC